MARKPKAPRPRVPTSAERRAAALRENLRRRKRQRQLRGASGPKAPTRDDD